MNIGDLFFLTDRSDSTNAEHAVKAYRQKYPDSTAHLNYTNSGHTLLGLCVVLEILNESYIKIMTFKSNNILILNTLSDAYKDIKVIGNFPIKIENWKVGDVVVANKELFSFCNNSWDYDDVNEVVSLEDNSNKFYINNLSSEISGNTLRYNKIFFKHADDDKKKKYLTAKSAKLKKYEDTIESMKSYYKNILDKWYNDRWDIVLNSNLTISLIIHFPNIEISNSAKNTHKIKDLYVIFEFNYLSLNRWSAIRMNGCRSSLTIDEINASYLHSHLGRINYNHGINELLYKRSFCTGHGSFATDISLFLNSERNAKNLDLFERIMISLSEYVTWESLEGTPYISMGQINNINRRAARNYFNQSEVEVVLNHTNNFDFDLLPSGDIDVHESYILDAISKYAKEIIIDSMVYEIEDNIYKITTAQVNNNYSQISSNARDIIKLVNTPLFTFKNKDVLFNIISNDITQNATPVPNKYLVNETKKKIQNEYKKRVYEIN